MATSTVWMVVGFGAVLAAGCGKKGAEAPAPEPAVPAQPAPVEPEPDVVPADPEPAPVPDPAGTPGAGMCGGIAGLRCAAGSACMDDPADGCDPAAGGRDCGGKCVGCEDPSLHRKYMSRDPNECARMRYMCAEGQAAFGDDCGCGCITKP